MEDATKTQLHTRSGLRLSLASAGDSLAPTVILLHGGGQTHRSWRAALPTLARRGYRGIAYDARGHGESDWAADGDYSIGSLAADLEDVAVTGSGPIALVGASMGGMTAFHAAATTLRRTAALVLVDVVPQPRRDGVDRIISFMAAHGDGFATADEAADAVATFYPERPRPSSTSGLARNLRKRDDGRLYWHWDPRLMQGGTGGVEPPDFESWAEPMAALITAPVLLVRGARSDVVDDAGVAHLQRILPQTEVLVVANAGHMLVGDRNDVFMAGVVDYLDRHIRRTSLGSAK